MISYKKQLGSVHLVLIIIGVAIVIGILGFVFWSNFINKTKPVSVPQKTSSIQSQSIKTIKPSADPYADWQTYTSTFGGGLSFKYPVDWQFNQSPPDTSTNAQGGKFNEVNIYSSKPQVVSQNNTPVTTNQFMCVTIAEYSGPWTTYSGTEPQPIKSEMLSSMEGIDIYLNTYQDSSLNRDNKPMGNIMRLIGSPSSAKGAEYIDSQNGAYFNAVAQYNCVQGGEGIKDLNADYFSQPETIQAELILKSLKF